MSARGRRDAGGAGSSFPSLFLILLAMMAPLLGAGMARAFDVTEVEASVYKVYAFPANGKGYGSGSGFLVSGKRTVVTNFHVVDNNAEFRIAFRDKNRVGQLVAARVVSTRPHLDIAVLETDQDLPGKALALGDYEPDKLANVITMGFPAAAEIRDPGQVRTRQEFEALLRDPTNLDATMTSGVVSRMNTADMRSSETRSLHARTVQHNAQFSPGNSGGPLFDECNAVVGINTFLRKDAQGVFFSIHSGELIRTLRELSIPYQAISQCTPGGGMGYAMPLIVVMSATLAAAALVLALRTGSLQQVGAQISRYTRSRPPSASPANVIGNVMGNVMGSVQLANLPAGAAALQPAAGGRNVQLESGKALILGRGKTSDIVVDNDTVSSRHASVEYNAQTGRLTVTDLGSSNGTYLNGRMVRAGQAAPGDVLRFGKAEYKFLGGKPAASPASEAVTARAWMLSGFDPSGRALQLEMRPAAGEASRSWVVGRDKARAQLVIDDTSVSGAHAEIRFVAGEGLTLRDLGSTNGTQVDGEGIGTRTVALQDAGQEVMFGAAKLRLSRLIT
ncbi:MAG: FHA domain-containing protein [Hyphomicrobiaceae bacterium]|nr:FHA domain-containing protein [Hyphomicrobiaceae bacterium]